MMRLRINNTGYDLFTALIMTVKRYRYAAIMNAFDQFLYFSHRVNV